jgi:hypothetical protein
MLPVHYETLGLCLQFQWRGMLKSQRLDVPCGCHRQCEYKVKFQ